MIELDLGEDIEFQVKLNGQTYVMREPTVKEVDALKEIDPKSGTETVIAFLVTLGMPREIVEGMGASKSRKLIDGLMESLTKKK